MEKYEERYYQNANKESERKWKEDGDFKKGRFTKAEESIIATYLSDYAKENGISKDSLLEMMSNRLDRKKANFWTKIAESLPSRSVLSIQNFCRRRFNIKNYKRTWSKEEEDFLMQMVKKHGNKWTEIAFELGRTPHNVRDKWRTISDGHGKKRELKPWNIQDLLLLIRLIEKSNDCCILEQSDEEIIDGLSHRCWNKSSLKPLNISPINKC